MKSNHRALLGKIYTTAIIGVFFIGIALPIPRIHISEAFSSVIPSPTSSRSTYTWIWDEFSNATGPIAGDDSVVWGRSLGPYYNYNELSGKLFRLQYSFPDLVDLFSIGKSHEGRDLWTLRLTNRSITSQKTEFHLVAHHHSREAITILNAMYFVDKLIYGVTMGNSTLIDMLARMEIYVTPVLNPDGLEVVSWFPWMRKNRAPIDDDGDGVTFDEVEILDFDDDDYVARYNDGEYYEGADGPDFDLIFGEDPPGGVDLNRNYDYKFIGSGSSNDPANFLYRGEYPFSEPETQAIRDFVSQHDFNFAVSLHSGVRAIIAPWGYTNLPTPDQAEFDALIQRLKGQTGYPSWDEIGGYYVNGEWGDWMYGSEGVFAFTLETYVDGSSLISSISNPAIDMGIWDYFNPPGDLVLSESRPVWRALDYLLTEPRITISNSKPKVQVVNPIEPFSGDNITLSWQAEDLDNDSLFYNVYLSEDGLLWTQVAESLETTSFQLEISDILEFNASYYVKVSASDSIDSVFDIAEAKLIGQDSADQLVNFEGLKDGIAITGVKKIEVEVENPPAIQQVIMFVDDLIYAEDKEPPFEFSWNTNQEFEGYHTVSFEILFIDGKTSRKSFSVYTFISTSEEPTEISQSRSAISKENRFALIDIVFLIIVGLFLRRIRRTG
ncbi:MAG: M14 family zinc carboxypeptidase [Candidatus Hodarchaeales archaeon]